MLFNIIMFFILLIIISLFVRLIYNQYDKKLDKVFDSDLDIDDSKKDKKEKGKGKENDKTQESFISNPGGIPVPSHQEYVNSSQQKVNNVANLINLSNPSIPVNSNTPETINVALETVTVDPNPNGYQIGGINTNTGVPTNIPSNLKLAKMCESKGTSCSAFDDSNFAANCGVSFDIKGKSFTGKPHIGGMFVSPSDRTQQLQQMSELDSAGQDGYKAFKPTLGSAKPGTFSLTKDQCIVVKERIECEKKQTFNSPNCTQCYTSGSFHRVDPSTGRLPSTLKLFGHGIATISSENGIINKVTQALNHNKAFEITIPATSEGSKIILNVVPDSNDKSGKPIYILGYIAGQTPRGVFKLDLMSLIESDLVTSSRPKIGGANIVDGFRSFVLMPGTGQKTMNLSGMIPFSFLSLYDGDAKTCDNGPIITQSTSATFLESDPCFNSKNKPGNYTIECLQERWIELGGTAQGTGYPNTQDKANAIQIDSNGNALNIDTIVNNLYPKMVQASTGLNANGSNMTIPQWNNISMWGLGVPISTPCDGSTNQTGYVTQECLEYLYLNQGSQSHIGATYTLPTTDSSLKGSVNGSNTYCQPGAPIDPSTLTGKQFIQSALQNGIQAVKNAYDQIHRSANDNTLSNEARKQAVNLCYGVNIDDISVQSGIYQGSAVPVPSGPLFVAIYGNSTNIAYTHMNTINSNNGNINWIQLGGSGFIDMALTPDGKLFELNGANGLLYSPSYIQAYQNSPSWNYINTHGVKFIQIATDGVVLCGVDVNNNPWYSTIEQAINGNFTQLPSVSQKIIPYNNGFVCLGLNNYIWYLTSPSSSWNMITINNQLTFKDFAIDDNTTIFIGIDNNLYYMNSNMFVSNATANPITMPPGIDAKSVSISKKSIAFVDTNGNYWYCKDYTSPVWASPQWIQLNGTGGVKIRHRIP